MATKLIPDLTATNSPLADGDLVVIEKADGSGTKKMTFAQLCQAVATKNYVNNGTTTASYKALDARYGKTLTDQVSTLNSHWINGQTITTGSFDDIKDPGMYYIGPSVTNSPYGSAYWRLLVISTGGAPTQFAINNGNDSLYFRRCSNNSWSNWAIVDVPFLHNSDRTDFTPTVGSSYSGYDGCYYYKVGYHVHLHIGLSGLTAGTTHSIFTLPSGFRPYGSMTFKGENNGVGTIASLRINGSGALQVCSEGTYALIDAFYDAFS